MKRWVVILPAILFCASLLPPLHAAEEVRPLGMTSATGGTSGDIRIGNTCTTSPGGVTYCGLNTRHLLFFSDNTVSVDRLYTLASAGTGFPYSLGGTWLIDNRTVFFSRLGSGTPDNSTYLRGDGFWAEPPGTGTGDGDMMKSVYDVNDDGVVDSAVATAITAGLIIDSHISEVAGIGGAKLADGSIAPGKLYSAGGVPGSGTYYRGDGYWGSVSAAAQGDTGQLQYNDNGAFAALPGAGYNPDDNTLRLPPSRAPSFDADQRDDTGGMLTLREASVNGSEWVRLKAPNSIADNLSLTLPAADGTNGQCLVTDGAGALGWGSGGGGGSTATVKDFTILKPTAADNSYLYKAQFAQSVTGVHCIATGGGTIQLRILKCNSSGGSCAGIDGSTTITCDSDGAADDGSLSSPAISAGSWVSAVYSNVSGTVDSLTYSIYMTETQ